ncbi:SSI family serine proteinase inhibitor [Streptomyces sp. NPDC087425]|uniref:SSI family serine proteinase inhibitor n=1 Tax=unclassified Streptomyces TaxID=2593676 RepID=UPI0038179F97
MNVTSSLRAGLLAATLLLGCATPAGADAAHTIPGNHLYLTVTKGTPQSSDTRGTLLMCAPPQGHSRAAEACAQLATARGDIAAIPAARGYCPALEAPVAVHARGVWDGRSIEYRHTFPNACVLADRTGAVFALDT